MADWFQQNEKGSAQQPSVKIVVKDPTLVSTSNFFGFFQGVIVTMALYFLVKLSRGYFRF